MKNEEMTNPSNQYIVSYNDSDFYCNSINLFTIPSENNTGDIYTYCNGLILESNEKVATFQSNICDNLYYFNKIKEMQTKHTGADSRHEDSRRFYETEQLKTVNLGVGILILMAVIYKNYRSSE
jgi:hypothetical protein